MLSPFITDTAKDAEMISSFGGLDKNIQIPENFFSDMKNMSSDNYPMLSARKPRGATTLPEGVFAMETCNTFLTRDDIQSGEIVEDVFALVTENSDGEAVFSHYKKGVYEGGGTVIGKTAAGTTLISQAGYVYAFPQGYRVACYSGGESGPLKNEMEIKRIAEKDSMGLSPTARLVLAPCDDKGATGDGCTASRIADGEYTQAAPVLRELDQLIIVKESGMGVNQYGCTVYVGTDGVIKEIRDWTSEKIDLTDSAYALTGNGKARAWLKNSCAVGNKVQLDGLRVEIYGADAFIIVDTKPESPANGTLWKDRVTGTWFIYSSAHGEWMPYTTNYILLSFETGGAGTATDVFEVLQNGKVQTDKASGDKALLPFEGFSEGDAIKIDGVSEEYDGSYVIASVAPRGLILNGTIDDTYERDVSEVGDSVKILRSIPKMDFVIESGNRLWGCYYGIGEDGKVINEIYASALGDPTNWYRYAGISTDSWTATVGADGPFTGAIQYGGYPLFFKENTIIRVYGSAPSSFSTAVYNYRGVAKGSHKSLAICDEVLYYLSTDGVMAYNGSVPQKVSDALGNDHYRDGVAGSIGSKYYLSCADNADNVHLFVFNARYGVWHREDDLRAEQFLRHKTKLYILTEGRVITAAGEGEEIEFKAVTGEWGLSNPYRKHFGCFIIRAIVPLEAELTVYSSHEGSPWKTEAIFLGEGMEVLTCRIVPRKCDRIRLKFEGRGQVKLLSVYREIVGGGLDVR